MSNRPVIALSGYQEEVSWGAWTLEATTLPWWYIRAIRDAGGEPIVLPPGGHAGILQRVDALVLTWSFALSGDVIVSVLGVFSS